MDLRVHISLQLLLLCFYCCPRLNQADRVLTPYQRSFTSIRNISCAQCTTAANVKGKKTAIEADMLRQKCFYEPDLYFKLCSMSAGNEPRGCGKIITYSKIDDKDVYFTRRFCASSGTNANERGCKVEDSSGFYTETCVCGGNNCNAAADLTRSPILYTFSAVIAYVTMLW